jgi:hypothetical protein
LAGETGFDVLLSPLRLAGPVAEVIVKLQPLELAGRDIYFVNFIVVEYWRSCLAVIEAIISIASHFSLHTGY